MNVGAIFYFVESILENVILFSIMNTLFELNRCLFSFAFAPNAFYYYFWHSCCSGMGKGGQWQ